MRPSSLLLAALALGACARATSRRAARPEPRGAVAALADSATVRKLCADPDEVLARRKACVLRDQSPKSRIF
jgi:hypothetical protein